MPDFSLLLAQSLFDQVWDELFGGPTTAQVVTAVIRLILSIALGALVGYDREQAGGAAGLRTHMLVALASTLFVLAPLQAGADLDGESRIIQGVAAGIGFVGAGAILKSLDSGTVKGLTTAASIWFTSAVGIAVAAGRIWLPVVSAIFAWLILSVLRKVERKGHGLLNPGSKTNPHHHSIKDEQD